MLWKTIGGRLIYSSTSGIYVYDNFFYRWLTFDNSTLQTLVNKYKPEKIILPYLHALTLNVKIRPSDCCLLGLGGGAAISVLEKMTNSPLIAVEKNEEIIKIAAQYFNVKESSHLKIIQDDAFHYLQNNKVQFENLLIDVYGSQSFPTSCLRASFFEAAKACLKTEGILAINLANFKEFTVILDWLKACFNHFTLVIPIKKTTNIVILAGQQQAFDRFLQQVKENKLVKELVWDAQFGNLAFF